MNHHYSNHPLFINTDIRFEGSEKKKKAEMPDRKKGDLSHLQSNIT